MPEVDLMISCRPHDLPREFSSIIFVAFYLPPETDAGTKTTLNELYKAISKQENAHPEAVLLDLNAGNLKSVLLHFYQMFTPHTEKLSLALNLANLTITLSS